MKEIINRSTIIGNCEFCYSEDVPIYAPNELALFFRNIFDLYVIGVYTDFPIEVQIEMDFEGKIFSNAISENRKKLLEEIISDDSEQYKHLFKENVVLKLRTNEENDQKSLAATDSWEKFVKEIKSVNRFHIKNTLDLLELGTLLKRYSREIPKGKKYFRARISESDQIFDKADMGNPPANRAKAGRANPQGISYLYLSNDVLTTLYEARSSLFDYVSIGEFRLNDNITVLSLRGDRYYDPVYLAEQNELEDFLIYSPFISRLEHELSRPLRKTDNELDYIPTQYLSEFIKSLGYHGVEYQSSLNPSGYNLAIFEPNKFECIKVELYEVGELGIEYKKVSI